MEFQIFKAEMSHYICLQDKNYFQNLSDSMQKEIETIKNSIDKDTLKLEIEEEKKRNKIEYNLIAENVIKFDEKKNLQEKIDIINNEIQILTKNHQDNILSISQKEKELHLLVLIFKI